MAVESKQGFDKNILKAMGWERLDGRIYRNIETGQILPRRQVDKLRNIYYEQKSAQNKLLNPELQQQRPARGRKSTLPKKPKRSRGKGKGKRAKRIRLSNGLEILVKDFDRPEWDDLRKWLLKNNSKGSHFRLVGHYETTAGPITRAISGYIIMSTNNINRVIESLIQKNPSFLLSIKGSFDFLTSISAYILLDD